MLRNVKKCLIKFVLCMNMKIYNSTCHVTDFAALSWEIINLRTSLYSSNMFITGFMYDELVRAAKLINIHTDYCEHTSYLNKCNINCYYALHYTYQIIVTLHWCIWDDAMHVTLFTVSFTSIDHTQRCID